MIGIKVSAWIAGLLICVYLISKCLRLISMPNDFMVVCGVVGLLILLAAGITIFIKVVKSLIKLIRPKEEV